MKLPREGYLSKFDHVEIARFFPEEDRMKRIMKKDGAEYNPVLIPWDDIYDFSSKHDDIGIYHSIRHYSIEDGGINGPSLAPMHFDIDHKEDQNQAYLDTKKLVDYLLDDIGIPYQAIGVYFSGMKGFHVLIEPIAVRLNLVHENSADIFRFVAGKIAEELNIDSFDWSVYDQRRIWRLAGSRHQKTGKYKIPCKDMVIADKGLDYISEQADVKPSAEDLEIPDQEFDYKAAVFFSEMVARYETENWEREQDKLANFLSRGHTSESDIEKMAKEFSFNRLRTLCPAVDNIVDKAYKTHYLDHYERLFLCSLLSYTQESIAELHKTLSQCSDYNFSISDLHIQDWIRRREMGIGGRPYTCSKAATVGIVCSGCDTLEPKTYENNFGSKHQADPSPVRFAYKYHEIK